MDAIKTVPDSWVVFAQSRQQSHVFSHQYVLSCWWFFSNAEENRDTEETLKQECGLRLEDTFQDVCPLLKRH